MTLTSLIDIIRRRHNVVGDTFWSDQEIIDLIYAACVDMAREAYVIEQTYTTTTVASTQSYAYPTNTIAIRRITYNGWPLQKITFREDDRLTGMNAATTSTGTSMHYYLWNETIYLRPIPDSAVSLVIYSFNEPTTMTSASSLEIPSQFQIDTVDYALMCMTAKEQNFQASEHYRLRWEARLSKIKQWQRKKLRADAFTNVVDCDGNTNFLGTP